MRLNLIATFLTALAASAVADFKFSKPNSQFYAVANATTTITWDYSGDGKISKYHMEILRSQISLLMLT